MAKRDVELSKLSPPQTRAYADPAKLQRMGTFDWTKHTPIIVEQVGTQLLIQDGMTRVEAARRAGIAHLPAYVYPNHG
jgi:ParB-like chromosome segregation protein Spo0J